MAFGQLTVSQVIEVTVNRKVFIFAYFTDGEDALH